LACKAHRFLRGLAWGGALLLGTVLLATGLTSCAAPSFTYVADSGNNTYFKVPYGWRQISPADLCTVLRVGSGSTSCPTGWVVAYEADHKPTAHDFLSGTLAQPFVFAEVAPYTSQTGGPLTDDTLRDYFLPVTVSARSGAALTFPLTSFKQLRDDTLSLGGGVHGVRETFDYTYPGLAADTFDEVILANAAGTTVYFMVVHCTTSCYGQDKTAINDVMSSFTVRS
jgi:hypothetical protein